MFWAILCLLMHDARSSATIGEEHYDPFGLYDTHDLDGPAGTDSTAQMIQPALMDLEKGEDPIGMALWPSELVEMYWIAIPQSIELGKAGVEHAKQMEVEVLLAGVEAPVLASSEEARLEARKQQANDYIKELSQLVDRVERAFFSMVQDMHSRGYYSFAVHRLKTDAERVKHNAISIATALYQRELAACSVMESRLLEEPFSHFHAFLDIYEKPGRKCKPSLFSKKSMVEHCTFFDTLLTWIKLARQLSNANQLLGDESWHQYSSELFDQKLRSGFSADELDAFSLAMDRQARVLELRKKELTHKLEQLGLETVKLVWLDSEGKWIQKSKIHDISQYTVLHSKEIIKIPESLQPEAGNLLESLPVITHDSTSEYDASDANLVDLDAKAQQELSTFLDLEFDTASCTQIKTEHDNLKVGLAKLEITDVNHEFVAGFKLALAGAIAEMRRGEFQATQARAMEALRFKSQPKIEEFQRALIEVERFTADKATEEVSGRIFGEVQKTRKTRFGDWSHVVATDLGELSKL